MDVPYFPNEDFMHVLHERPLRRPGTEDFLGPAMRDRGRRGNLIFLQTLILMGDWCRQETDIYKPKETTAKGKKLMTP